MKRAGFLFALLTVMSLATPAFAVVILDFGTGNAGAGGTVTVSGGNAIGTAIPIDSIVAIGTSADGTYSTYGTAIDAVGSNGSAALNFDTAAHTISVVGGVCVLGNDTCTGGAGTLVTTTTLLTGTISSFTLSGNGTPVLSITATGPDTKSASLLSALGVAGTQFQYLVFNFSADTTVPFGPTYTATSTDLINTQVPEPTSITLLGSLLLGCSVVVRRRVRAKQQ